MRFVVLCVALGCWTPVAAAQVSFVRRQAEDERVAHALEKLIGEPVQLLDAAGSDGPQKRVTRVTVSIDRQRGVLRVVTPENAAGLTRMLDRNLLADSPYAVALAAAELLELSMVDAQRVRRLEPAPTEVGSSSDVPRVTSQGRAEVTAVPSEPDLRAKVARDDLQPEAEQRDDESRPLPEPATRSDENPASPQQPEPAEETRVTSDATERSDESRLSSAATGPRSLRRSGLPDYAFGVDLELQSQPGHTLSFVRPAVSGEVAWGRDTKGLFWAAGARVSAPFGRELQPLAVGPAEDSRVRAQAMDAALLATLGYAFGRLGLTTHLAGGVSYLRVEGLDAERHVLGHDVYLSPLLAAGIGARLSVALGFALAVRGEAQWAGRATTYRVGREPVLESGPFRVGVLAGILWESAFGRAEL